MSSKRKSEGHSRKASRPRFMKAGGSRKDSGRDSGFSGSEYMSSTMDTTDSEDSSGPTVKQRSLASQMAVVGGSFPNMSPVIIMNNVVLKQPGETPPLKSWGFSPTVEVVQPGVQQPQVVFLQPVVSRQASKEPASSRYRRPKKYLPILKSYPKIAPHPGDSSGSSSGRGTASSSSSSSSSTTSSFSSASVTKRSSVLTSVHREHLKRERQLQRSVSAGPCPSVSGSSTPSLPSLPSSPGTPSPPAPSRLPAPCSSTESSAGSSPASNRPSYTVGRSSESSSSSPSPSDSTSKDQGCPPGEQDGDTETKRKRFSNTYNILSNSGLLDIAMRTKELHRQNRRTQSELDQLKEHTDTFLRALLSGDASICVELQARLQEEDMERVASLKED